MMKTLRRSLVLALVVALLVTPVAASTEAMSAYDVSDASIAGDFLLGRPLGLLATVLGSVLFVTSLPLSALGGNVSQAAHLLVTEPAKFTFSRPLGQF